MVENPLNVYLDYIDKEDEHVSMSNFVNGYFKYDL